MNLSEFGMKVGGRKDGKDIPCERVSVPTRGSCIRILNKKDKLGSY